MLDNTKIKGIIVLVISIFLAIYLGNAAATAQFEAIAWVVGVSATIFLLALGRDVWLLIPFSLLCIIRFPAFPGSFSVADLTQVAFVGFSFLLIGTRRLHLGYRVTSTEIFSVLILATVVQVFLRNPVGLNVLGSSSVGARPYFTFAIAFATAFILAGSRVELKKFQNAVNWCLVGGVICAIINVLAYVPGLEYYAALYFGAGTYAMINGNSNSPVDSGAATRISAGIYVSQVLGRWTVSNISPFRALVRPFWLVVMIVTLAAAMISGFRNHVVYICLLFALGVYYWSGLRAIFVCIVLGVLGLASLAIFNSIKPLPPNVQRSLSFLPGTWEERYIEDAADSTEWRIEMWKEALGSDRWIKNKTLGDGLGFTKQELDLQEAAKYKTQYTLGAGGFDEQRESFLISGDYHSGPVSFVRTTGYVGLAVFLLATIFLARRAHRFIRQTRGTPWFRIACFFCIPMVIHPLFFTLIFGSFGTDSALYFIHAGLLCLLEKSFRTDTTGQAPLPVPSSSPSLV